MNSIKAMKKTSTQFMEKIKKAEEGNIDFKQINVTRYTDWAITTPIMLLVLCLVLGYNNKSTVKASFFLLILIVNYLMLVFGYLGEINYLNKRLAQLGGFIFFFLLYALIYFSFLHNNYKFDNSIIFWAFVVFWAIYGILYDLDEESKNIGFNILDLFSKCFVGIFFWAYLTGVIKIF